MASAELRSVLSLLSAYLGAMARTREEEDLGGVSRALARAALPPRRRPRRGAGSARKGCRPRRRAGRSLARRPGRSRRRLRGGLGGRVGPTAGPRGGGSALTEPPPPRAGARRGARRAARDLGSVRLISVRTNHCRLRAAQRADRRASRTTRRITVAGRGGGDLERHMAGRGAPLNGHRGEHPRPEAGRAALERRPGARQQGAERVLGGSRLRHRGGLGLRPRPGCGRMDDGRAHRLDPGAARSQARARSRVGRGAASPGLGQRGSGSFREHDIRPFPGGMQPPRWTEVPAAMAEWLAETRSLGDADSSAFPEALARVHARFEQITPSSMGTGEREGLC